MFTFTGLSKGCRRDSDKGNKLFSNVGQSHQFPTSLGSLPDHIIIPLLFFIIAVLSARYGESRFNRNNVVMILVMQHGGFSKHLAPMFSGSSAPSVVYRLFSSGD